MTYPEQNLAHMTAELQPSSKHITPATCTASGGRCVSSREGEGALGWEYPCAVGIPVPCLSHPASSWQAGWLFWCDLKSSKWTQPALNLKVVLKSGRKTSSMGWECWFSLADRRQMFGLLFNQQIWLCTGSKKICCKILLFYSILFKSFHNWFLP